MYLNHPPLSPTHSVDMVLPINVEVFSNNVLQVLAAIAAVSYVSPWFALAVLPLAAIFLFLLYIFQVCFRRLKCLDHVTRSPVLAHLGASVQGLDTVQAYGVEKQFHDRWGCALISFSSKGKETSRIRWNGVCCHIMNCGVVHFSGNSRSVETFFVILGETGSILTMRHQWQ